MKTHNLTPNTPEWLAYRATMFNASDAPAMMGASPYKTRAQLLREMHTGLAGEVDASTQRRFDDGHRFEALALPLAEPIVGESLYVVVGSEGRYSASFDGLTLAEDIAWEHKSLNDALRAILPADAVGGPEVGAALPLLYRVQMEQHCMVSGAGRELFTASKWTDDGELIEARHCWYEPDAELRAEIIAGWQQFAADLAVYVPPAIPEIARAEPMESLPAVAVRLDGALTVAGNLPSFAAALKAFVGKIPTRPATDNEFATVDAACKALKKAEEALDQAEAGALASITDVEAMRRAVADCRKLARDTRLAAEKMVERRKQELNEQAVAAARRALDDHIAALNAELAPMRLLSVAADFPGSIKGLRSIASKQDALDTTLANGKIAADAQARGIRANVAAFKAATGDDRALQSLFADLAALVHKAADDFAAVLDGRITKHRADEAAREAKRQADEAARIAAAEQRAREQAQREAEQRLADEREKHAQAERDRVPTERRAESARLESLAVANRVALAAAAPAVVAVQACRPEDRATLATPAGAELVAKAAAALLAPVNEPATLKLGTICDRLGFIVRADFLADSLHIRPASKADGRPGLYTESQFAVICHQLRSHISAMAELYAGEVA